MLDAERSWPVQEPYGLSVELFTKVTPIEYELLLFGEDVARAPPVA